MTPTTYRLAFHEPRAHLIDVEARFDAADLGETIDLRMAAWSPGSYLVRDYARHLQDLTVTDEAGRALAVEKVDKAGWRVRREGARQVVARYRVYAHELTVRTNHVDQTHAFVNGPSTYLWLAERQAQPARVEVVVPTGWQLVCTLPRDGEGFRAGDLEELLDTPLHLGAGPVVELEAAGRPTTLALWGRFDGGGVADLDTLGADVVKVIDEQARLFAGVPYERYAFILMLTPGGHGGLEHRASTALLSSPFALANRKKYEDLLELFSHEFFHLWNVKRVRPRGLAPPDLARESYTRSLWVAEGWTSYYDRYLLVRAGLMPAKRYLERLGEDWAALLAVPGRARQSLEEASFDAWIKLYRPDENTPNSTVSYYLKGALVATCLDLEIRRRSEGRHSLDDALLHLWREYGAGAFGTGSQTRGYADADVEKEVERAVGLDLSAFFAACVRGREDPGLAAALAGVGLALRPKAPSAEDGPQGWLGVKPNGTTVSVAFAGGPAASAGLYAGDEIIAVDGYRVDAQSLGERIAARKPGDTVTLAVFRRDELHHVPVALGERPPEGWEILPMPDASEDQKTRQRGWLGG